MTLTSENLATAILKLVAVDALPQLMGSMVVGNLATRDFEPQIARPGDTVSVPALWGTKDVVLDTHAEATFQIPDVTRVLAVPDLLKLYMQPATIALAERIESDLLGLASQFTANPPVGEPSAALAESTIDAADEALFNAKVPANIPKYLVVSGNAYSSLRRINRFSEYQTAGEAGLRALVDGTVGKIKDFYAFRSRSVHQSPTGTTNNLAFARDAIGLVTRRLSQPLPGTGLIAEYAEMGNFGMRVLMDYQPNTLAQRFTIDVLYGTAILRNQSGVLVKS